MRELFIDVINSNDDEKRSLFLTAGNRLGVPLRHIEKDFWVCLVLDLLFNQREEKIPRLLFKGGTSLSKAYSLITRFSEDIDITIFREDLCEYRTAADLHLTSGKQQRKYIDIVMQACIDYIKAELKPMLELKMNLLYKASKQKSQIPVVVYDMSDPSMQTLLVQYSSVDKSSSDYVKPFVKIECGARSALDPHRFAKIQPYIAQDMQMAEIFIENVVTIHAERTFWDKIIILHGLRRSFDKNQKMRQDGQRLSRHYYDIYQLLKSEIHKKALADVDLGLDCVNHASIFFNSASLDLANAKRGTYALSPSAEMFGLLKNDYSAMRGMIFGDAPSFDEIIDGVRELEGRLNDG